MREDSRLMTTSDVARLLGVSTHQVTRYCREGRLPHYRLGPKTYRFEREAIWAWLGTTAGSRESRDG